MKDPGTFFHALYQDMCMLFAVWVLSIRGVIGVSLLGQVGEPESGGLESLGNDFPAPQ